MESIVVKTIRTHWSCKNIDSDINRPFSSQSIPKRNMFSDLRKLFIIPVVHAEELPKEPPSQVRENKNPLFKEWDIQNILASESGWDRVKKMYTKTKGEKSREQYGADLQLVASVIVNTSMITFVFASVLGAKASKEEFIERNKGEKFKTQFVANRRMHDATLRGGIWHGLKYTGKAFLITSSFMMISQTIAVYRNKSSPMEYAAAGGLVMGAWRAYYGPRALFAGSIIGGVAGLCIGCVAYGAMYLANQTQQQRHIEEIHSQLERKYAWQVSQQSKAVSETGS